MNSYNKENLEILKNFLERTFFKSWKQINSKEKRDEYLQNYNSLELYLSDACHLKCKYCYINKFKKRYFPDEKLKEYDVVFKNTKILLNWLYENNYMPKIELFGGDALNQKLGFDIINLIIDMSKNGKKVTNVISIPTNMNFLMNDEETKFIEEKIVEAKEQNIFLSLSASVDGIYMEENREFIDKNKKRDEKFYEKLFEFSKKYNIGFHPMIYANKIDKWWDNFLWFQNNFKKYNINPFNLYLLEVRNYEYTKKDCYEVYLFYKKLIKWTYEKLIELNLLNDKSNFLSILFKLGGFNTLTSPFVVIGRGIGCSIQSNLTVRMGDLTVFPCHRLAYPFFKLFKFKVLNDQIVDIENFNTELLIAINSFNAKNMGMCAHCLIRDFCSLGCLGSQFEVNGEIFNNIVSVCRLEFYRIKGIFDGLQEINKLEDLYKILDEDKKNKILNIIKELKDEIK